MFRPNDPPEYNALYLIPASVFFGGYTWGIMNNLPEIHNFAALGSSLCCIGAIASLSSQKTARFGNNLGIVSVLVPTYIMIMVGIYIENHFSE